MEKKHNTGMHVYYLSGEPTPLMRHRFVRSTAAMYNPQSARKMVASIELAEQHRGKELFSGPIHIDVTFYMPIPKTNGVRKKPRIIPGAYHIFKPDLDNCIKWVGDVATGLGSLFKDDCIIAKITAQKIYDDNPRTEFVVVELK